MSKAYIINNNTIVAVVDTELKNGSIVKFSSVKSEEKLNANMEYNLVDASTCKISRAKKWSKDSRFVQKYAESLNDDQFYIY